MSGWAKLNWVLLILFVAVFALDWVLERDPTRRNFEVLPGMVTPVAYESFSANPVLDAGMTLQTPPEGTIPRGDLPLPYEATPEDAKRAGRELENPFSADDSQAVARGEFVFNTYCLLCHGAKGEGDGPVASRGFPTPASLLAANARDMADGTIFHIVTYGQGNMPGHASQLEPEDRWKVALWVRRLQQEAGPVIDAPGVLPDEPPGEGADEAQVEARVIETVEGSSAEAADAT